MRRLLLHAPAFALAAVSAVAGPVVLENDLLRYTISADAKNVAFVDRATGVDYLRTNPPSSAALVRAGGETITATAASMENGRLTLRFGESGIVAVVRLEALPSCIVLEVESVRGQVDALTFLNVPLTLQGMPDEPFGACALSLNLFTRVDALAALQRELRASCEKKFGLAGARVAIVGAPTARMLATLQETLTAKSELPVCNVAGPWAHEVPFNHGSYVFNFGSLTETNVEDWIERTRSLGFTQIDNHGGGAFFRFGDMELNREKWPDGWESWRRIVARLHAEGIGSIFHSYAFFIDKRSKYVTPIPDSRLDAFRTFTLAKPLTQDATEMTVNESTAGLNTITGFFVHNSVLLHIGDELVAFGGVRQQAPWGFTGLQRGALGTKAAEHARGSTARHLKECFGLLVPDVESSLFGEIAANHADIVNRCDFDGVYLDAIDGSSILRGGDECWFWANKFVVEIQNRLKKPVGMEMSAMWHHFWQYRTRWQAWDYPRRGHKRFIDLHAAGVNGGLLLPLHLGWWNFESFNPPQVEPTYPDVIETLGARLIGWDAGISLTAGVDRESLRNTPLFRRAVDTLRTCEALRHGKAFDASTRARLREPGTEFVLCTNAAGEIRFRRIQSLPQTICLEEPWTLAWPVTNVYAAQPLRFRLEALMAASISTSNRVLVADPANDAANKWNITSAQGVVFRRNPSVGQDRGFCELIATNSGGVPRNAAWARMEKRFDPVLDVKHSPALAVEIEGDGSGALLAFRLESPAHLAHGAVADRYVPLDFKGRRRFTLVETESARWSDYTWNDGKHAYQVYRESVNFGAIESLSIWLQNIPAGHETKVLVGPIHAVPTESVSVSRPAITLEGNTLQFPVDLLPGSWIEANGPEDCAVYSAKGEPLGKVAAQGVWPALRSGANQLTFSCEGPGTAPPRGRVVVFTQGDVL